MDDDNSIQKIRIGNKEHPFDALTLDGKTKEQIGNLVTSIDSSSTDEEYPSAKCIYDIIYGDGGSTPTPVTNWIKLSGLNAGDPVEVGSGYDPSDLDNNPPILYDSNGDVMEVSQWRTSHSPFGVFLCFRLSGIMYYIYSLDNPQYLSNDY